MSESVKQTEAAWLWTAQLKLDAYREMDSQDRPPSYKDFEGWGKTYQFAHNIFAMRFSPMWENEMRFYSLKQRSRSRDTYGQYATFYKNAQYNRYDTVRHNSGDDIPF